MSSSNINPSLLETKWTLDGKEWRVLIQASSSSKRTKWQRFQGPIASMRYTSSLKVEGRKTEVILFRTTEQEEEDPEIAVPIANLNVSKIGPGSEGSCARS